MALAVTAVTESVVEDAAIDWLAAAAGVPPMARTSLPIPGAERADYGTVVLEGCLRMHWIA